MRILLSIVFGLIFSFNPQPALAIPPPDMIISGLQSVAQVFGVAVAFLVSAYFLMKETLVMWWELHRKKMIAAGTLLLILGLLVIAWYGFKK